MYKLAVIGLLAGMSLAAPGVTDTITMTDGKQQQGDLSSYQNGQFTVAMEKAPGVLLGRNIPAQEVSEIVLSTTEQQLRQQYEQLLADPALKGVTMEKIESRADVLTMKDGTSVAGVLVKYTSGAFLIESATEANSTYPLDLVSSLHLSNQDYQYQKGIKYLEDFIKDRKKHLDDEAAAKKQGCQFKDLRNQFQTDLPRHQEEATQELDIYSQFYHPQEEAAAAETKFRTPGKGAKEGEGGQGQEGYVPSSSESDANKNSGIYTRTSTTQGKFYHRESVSQQNPTEFPSNVSPSGQRLDIPGERTTRKHPNPY